MTLIKEMLKEPVFQVALTLAVFVPVNRLYRKVHFFLFNPLILASVIVMLVIHFAGINYDTYNQGGRIITFFLGPATVALGVPLYKQIPVIRENFRPIMLGVFTGAVTAAFSTVYLAKLLGVSKYVITSIAAKSTTMPIAIGITEKLHGNTSVIVFAVAVTGIFGGAVGAEVMKLARVKSRVATGIGIGTASHAGGTSRAVQIGEVEGSMSGAAIVLTGIVTAVLAPFIVKLLI